MADPISSQEPGRSPLNTGCAPPTLCIKLLPFRLTTACLTVSCQNAEVMGHLKHSPANQAELRATSRTQSGKESFAQQVPTRWNNTVEIVNHVLWNADPLRATLAQHTHCLLSWRNWRGSRLCWRLIFLRSSLVINYKLLCVCAHVRGRVCVCVCMCGWGGERVSSVWKTVNYLVPYECVFLCSSRYVIVWEETSLSLVKQCIQHYVCWRSLRMTLLTWLMTCKLKIKTYHYKAGIVPLKRKTAEVMPVYKSGERHLSTNYRPI